MENPFVIDTGSAEKGGEIPADLDVIIIGGGPSGLAAALYNARAGFKVLVIEKLSLGGQIFLTNDIENYPGIEKVSGPALIKVMEKQAKNFGAHFVFDEVEKIEDKGKNLKEVLTASGMSYKAPAVIISSGAKYRDLGVPGEEKFRGKGISNCATCDGAFYRNMEVAVVGGGDTAVEEGLFLTRFASKVYIIHRRDRLRAIKAIQDRAFSNSKIEFVLDSVVEEVKGENGVEQVVIKNVKSGGKSELKVKGLFVFIGLIPNTGFIKGFVDTDSTGYIKTDREMKTSREGVFACGDCVSKNLRQAITAAGEGAEAAYSAQHYVERLKGTEYV